MQDFEDQIAEARRVLQDPGRYIDRLWYLQQCWETLKLERGETVNFDRLREPAYLIAAPTVVPIRRDFRHLSEAIEPHRLGAIARVRARIAAGRHDDDGGAA